MTNSDIAFEANISKFKVNNATKAYNLSFKVNGDGKNFKLPDISAFKIHSGPNKSSTVIIGEGISEFGVNFIIVPLKTGKIEINPASIEVNSKIYYSNPLTVEVYPNLFYEKLSYLFQRVKKFHFRLIHKLYIAVIILLFILTNPTQNDFKTYLEGAGQEFYDKGIGRVNNFLIFSIYKNNSTQKRYIGVIKNFFPL